jgi:transcriptional regulator GlxA family with amidase domain
MPNNGDFLPGASRRPLVLFVAFPGMCMLDMAGPQTVFWCADRVMRERGRPGYARHTVSLEGGPVPTLEGVPMLTEALSGFDPAGVDTIVVPGAPNIEQVLVHAQPLVDWLRKAAASTRRTTSVCSGAFVLAQAGLLDGKRAATHYALNDRLKELHPLVEIDREAIFVQQGGTWTSAGVTAGIDLALALVEADCGRDVALAVARELVVFVKRPGGHAQFSALLKAQLDDGDRFEELHLWISDNLGSADLTVEALAARVLMSPRNFSRVYKETTGRTPAKAVEMFRLEAARRMLEDSSRNIDQIARDCGFGDEGRMRQCFQRNLSVSPSAYREQRGSAA